MTTKILPTIRRGRTEIDVPSNKGYATFISPAFGPGNYLAVGKKVLEAGLTFPTGDDTADLLHPAYCSPEIYEEPEFQDVRAKMQTNWIWAGNRDLWTFEGVYAVQDPTAIGRSQGLSVNKLELALKGGKEFSWGGVRVSEDGRVRFAPAGSYKLGEHTSESLAKDGFILANFSQDGAEKLGEVSSQFRYNPRTWGVEVKEGQAPEQRVVGLDSDRYDDRLYVYGNYWDDGNLGCAFGVCAPEKSE